MSLSALLIKVGDALLSKTGKAILTTLGVGIVTTTITLTLINKYISYATTAYDGLGDVIGLLGLAGFNVALSIIFSALVIRMTLNSKALSFRKSA